MATAANAGDVSGATAAMARVTEAMKARKALAGVPANTGLGAVVSRAQSNVKRAAQVAKALANANKAARAAAARAAKAAADQAAAAARAAAAAQAAENARTAAEEKRARNAQAAAEKAARNAAAAQAKAAANAAAEEARKEAIKAKGRAALRRAVALSRMTAAASGGSRRAALVTTMQKKPLEKFLTNFDISGPAPRNALERTTRETAVNNARNFLSKSMLRPHKGSTYPNKINWPRAVSILNNYNLTNAQKNMIRRVDIAVAAQPKKGRFEKRRPVSVNISGLSRDQAIQRHKDAMKAENNRRQRNEQERENRERRAKRASGSRVSAAPSAPATTGSFKPTYGVF